MQESVGNRECVLPFFQVNPRKFKYNCTPKSIDPNSLYYIRFVRNLSRIRVDHAVFSEKFALKITNNNNIIGRWIERGISTTHAKNVVNVMTTTTTRNSFAYNRHILRIERILWGTFFRCLLCGSVSFCLYFIFLFSPFVGLLDLYGVDLTPSYVCTAYGNIDSASIHNPHPLRTANPI